MYQMANGRYARTQDVTLASAVTSTATGAVAGSTLELGDKASVRLTLACSAVAGTNPSVTVTLETSESGTGGWVAVAAFAAVTGAGTQRKMFSGLDRFVRLNVTAVTGTDTPSATYTVSGEAL